MKDPNKFWGQYDVVICSPSIQSGISYNEDNAIKFDAVFGIFDNWTNMSSDAVQMLHCKWLLGGLGGGLIIGEDIPNSP